jgi:ATP-dependent DNA helicase RecG
MSLHINIKDLLNARSVESNRIEFKEGWNPVSIYRSVCAFANDFDNIGGGYVLVGVAENPETKTALRPVKGLSSHELAEIQKEMIGFNNLVKPYYAPKLFIEEVDEKQILVIWVIAGNERPYEAPETITAKNKVWKYFIRKYASSIEAKGAEKEELIALSNNIPFDDRANRQASISNISMVLVQDHLRKIESKLMDDIGTLSNVEVLQQMALLTGPEEYLFPRNVSLMMFSNDPSEFFPYTQVEIVNFPNGEAESFTEYPKITGPVPYQINRTLDVLRTSFLQEKVIKQPDKAESIRIWNYPLQAIEEILVNAFYHRDYQVREPIGIRIYANSIIFMNCGGPDRSIQLQSFQTGQVRPSRYRNRRLGDFLKELDLTEGKATGIPTVFKELKKNGSPEPRFNTDDDRTFFEVELFIHPAFKQKEKLQIDVNNISGGLQSIDSIFKTIIENSGIIEADYLISAQAGAQADIFHLSEYQIKNVIATIDYTQISAIAGAIAEDASEKQIEILRECIIPKPRETALQSIGLTNHRKNFNEHIKPLIDLGWLIRTIPHKPTSPNQQYLTTLKGRLILEFLKHKGSK